MERRKNFYEAVECEKESLKKKNFQKETLTTKREGNDDETGKDYEKKRKKTIMNLLLCLP